MLLNNNSHPPHTPGKAVAKAIEAGRCYAGALLFYFILENPGNNNRNRPIMGLPDGPHDGLDLYTACKQSYQY